LSDQFVVDHALPIGAGYWGAEDEAAMKFQKAAQATARKGVSTRVETTVAMELAASCQPVREFEGQGEGDATTSRES